MNKRNNLFTKNDYRHLVELRAFDSGEEDKAKMIVEGKAITYDDATVLFEIDGVEYSEIISRGAFEGADLNDAFFKYNHSDTIMAMARYKNGTLSFEERDDGVYIRAELANTTAGRDLYELIRRGDIDKMSFAFTIGEQSYDYDTRTWTVRRISKIWDVAAVPVPAYQNTQIFARRQADVEAMRVKEAEVLRQQREEKVEMARKAIAGVKNKLYKNKEEQ